MKKLINHFKVELKIKPNLNSNQFQADGTSCHIFQAAVVDPILPFHQQLYRHLLESNSLRLPRLKQLRHQFEEIKLDSILRKKNVSR